MSEQLSLTVFTQHLTSRFRMHMGASHFVDTELIQAADLGSTPQQEQFSVIFRGPADAFLQQGTYHTEHEHLGAFDLFITAVGKDAQGIQYQAVFNRFIQG
jgi:hypothetical protein